MPEVEALAKEFHDLAKTDTTFSPARFWQTINALDQAGVLFLHGMFVDDVLAGVLIGTVSPQMMTDNLVAQEIMWYVTPEHRNSLSSVRLLLAFEDWSKKRGANGIIMASFAATGDEKLGKFYERRGYQMIETHFLKQWPSSQQQ